MMARSVPIYIGAPEIADHFDEGAMVHVLKFVSLEAAAKHILYLDQNDTAYMEVLSRPWMYGNGTFRLSPWLSRVPHENLVYRQMAHLRDTLMAPDYQLPEGPPIIGKLLYGHDLT